VYVMRETLRVSTGGEAIVVPAFHSPETVDFMRYASPPDDGCYGMRTRTEHRVICGDHGGWKTRASSRVHRNVTDTSRSRPTESLRFGH